jgi:hypothetical protein
MMNKFTVLFVYRNWIPGGKGLQSRSRGRKKRECIIQVHGSNARNLSVQLSLSQASKNVVFLTLVFSLQQNWRRGQNRFCLEAREVGVDRGRDGPNNVHTYE